MTDAFIILGMHRSGTSALTGSLRLLGVDVGEDLMSANSWNEKGYWEDAQITAMHDEFLRALGTSWSDVAPLPEGWEDRPAARKLESELTEALRRKFSGSPLWACKDPRMCKLLPLWLRILPKLKVSPRFVLANRHPFEVAASLAQRDGLAADHALLLWLQHITDAERQTRGFPRTLVFYDELTSDGAKCLGRVGADLGLSWPRPVEAAGDELREFLDPSLWHHRSARALDDADGLASLAMECHEMLRTHRELSAPEVPSLIAALASKSESYRPSVECRIYRAALAAESAKSQRLEAALRERDQAVTRLRGELDDKLKRLASALKQTDKLARRAGKQQSRVAKVKERLRMMEASRTWRVCSTINRWSRHVGILRQPRKWFAKIAAAAGLDPESAARVKPRASEEACQSVSPVLPLVSTAPPPSTAQNATALPPITPEKTLASFR